MKRLLPFALAILALAGGEVRGVSLVIGVGNPGGSGVVLPRVNSVFLDALAADGRILAHFETTTGYKSSFTWRAGKSTDLTPPGATGGKAYLMNASGWIAGSFFAPIREGSSFAGMHFFTWRDGVMVERALFPGAVNSVRSIDENGRIFGLAANSYGKSVPFTWRDGVFAPLIPGDTRNVLSAEIVEISASGRVIGTITQFNNEKRGFTWADGVFTDLRDPGTPVSINATGEFVGTLFTTPPGFFGPVLVGYRWKDGVTTLAPETGFQPLQINDAGEVLGKNGVWNGARITRFFLSEAFYAPEMITAAGQVVGETGGDIGYYQTGVFSWKDGVAAELPFPATAHFCKVLAVDATGRLFGNYYTKDPPDFFYDIPHAFTWKDGVMTTLPAEGATGTLTLTSSSGRAVGRTGSHPFTWVDGQVTGLAGPPTLPGASATALAFNAAGVIIGNYYDSGARTYRACVWRDGAVATDLSPPGSLSSTAFLINDAGQIAGTFVDAAGNQRAFFVDADGGLANIVPPPAPPTPTPSPTPTPTASPSPSPTPVVPAPPAPTPGESGDRVAPRVTVAGPANRATPLDFVILSGRARDNDGIASVEIRTGHGEWRKLPGRASWYALLDLDPGRNVFSVRATDRSGNRSAVKTVVVVRTGS